MSAAEVPTEPAEGESLNRQRFPFVLAVLSVLAPLVMLTISGFLLGPLDGDLPYPPTPQEEIAYNAGKWIAWAAIAAAVAGAILVSIASHKRRMSAGAGWGVVTLAATGALGVMVFFVAFELSN